MTAYELMQRRQKLQKDLDNLASRTNGEGGNDPYIWELMTSVQAKIIMIDDTLKKVVVR
jgi:hypothetical protein